MKMKIYIDVNEKEIRRDPDWLATFLKGYLSQLAGYKVTDVELIKEEKSRRGKGIPIPPENLSWDESKAGELININDWEEEWIKKNITEEK